VFCLSVPVTIENDFHDAERQQTETHKTQSKKSISDTNKKMTNPNFQHDMKKRKLATQIKSDTIEEARNDFASSRGKENMTNKCKQETLCSVVIVL
jgi:hypothetical protein